MTPGNYTFSIELRAARLWSFKRSCPHCWWQTAIRLFSKGARITPGAPLRFSGACVFCQSSTGWDHGSQPGSNATDSIPWAEVGDCDIEPAGQLRGFDLLERGRLKSQSGRVLLSGQSAGALDSQIAKHVRFDRLANGSNLSSEADAARSRECHPLDVEFAHVREVFIGIERRRSHSRRRRIVLFSEMTLTCNDRLRSGIPGGSVAVAARDQCVAITAGRIVSAAETYQATEWSLHSRTNVDVVQAFLDVDIRVTPSPVADATASEVQVQVLPQSVP